MPIMGGLEATGMIRAYEDEENRPRTPIIALTAHAMIGDKERCLAAGVSPPLSFLGSVHDADHPGVDGRIRDETTTQRRPSRFDRQSPHGQNPGDQHPLARRCRRGSTGHLASDGYTRLGGSEQCGQYWAEPIARPAYIRGRRRVTLPPAAPARERGATNDGRPGRSFLFHFAYIAYLPLTLTDLQAKAKQLDLVFFSTIVLLRCSTI